MGQISNNTVSANRICSATKQFKVESSRGLLDARARARAMGGRMLGGSLKATRRSKTLGQNPSGEEALQCWTPHCSEGEGRYMLGNMSNKPAYKLKWESNI